MTISFYVAFKSAYGQSLSIKFASADGAFTELPMAYLNSAYWFLQVDTKSLTGTQLLEYSYIFKDQNNGTQKEFSKSTALPLKKSTAAHLEIVDEWNEESTYPHVFESIPFETVFKSTEKVKIVSDKKPTHIFKIKAPLLAAGKLICLTGNCKKMGNWSQEKPLLLEHKKNLWQLKLNLTGEDFPIEYKLGIYNQHTGQMEYEQGDNRQLPKPSQTDSLTILHHNIDFANARWKAAGINIPVSALRTNKSWGVGEFTDLNLLTQFAKSTGLRLIQLLPINDTTASHTNQDSYPYSAISSFALHPIYLNVQKMAHALSVKFSPKVLQQVEALNKMETLQYQQVLAIKEKAIAQLYQSDKQDFLNDYGWFAFFDLHRQWLVPYAAFCYLRDKYKTADYTSWPSHAQYNEAEIQQLASTENDFYDEIAIHYYTQYHLHLQLKDAVDYAHKNGIIIKGDLPIGVGRHSCDAWMNPPLFHIDMQAGAPPDAFATKGQNWSFPTYNWEKMAEDNYGWWRARMEYMSIYFDAIRIDHVLGFFRIWSIPLHAVEGILGKFVSAWPVPAYDFSNAGLHFNEPRYCQPYITEELLQTTFGADAAKVKEVFLDGYQFKETLNTQRKIQNFVQAHPPYASLLQGLFSLLGEVIVLKDDKPGQYHFRIGMHQTASYKALSPQEQQVLNGMYDYYFFKKQNELWEEEGIKKLNVLKQSTQMLICAEDLGMVPDMVEEVLADMQMLALEVQRMPKRAGEMFVNLSNTAYLSVVTPSTHDMATLREWWEDDTSLSQLFFNEILGNQGAAPFYAEDWLCRQVIQQHLNSPAMWAIFLLQDLLAMDAGLRKENPTSERINNPANPQHFWNYRMHLTLEELNEQPGFLTILKSMIKDSQR